MKINYDLHIHTGLSPCALDSMSPNNIVNMAQLMDLQVIAITDHNSCDNVEVVMEVAKDTPLMVIPGLEVETKEEIHMVCLFKGIEQAKALQKMVYAHLPERRNAVKIFGEQWLYDPEDEEAGKVERLLSFATDISVDLLVDICLSLDGVCIPAHIDRPSFSLLSNLGMIPEHMPVATLEISRYATMADYDLRYPNHLILQNSDAHELGDIGLCQGVLEVDDFSIETIIETLKGPYKTII